jgi:hypothetical protein
LVTLKKVKKKISGQSHDRQFVVAHPQDFVKSSGSRWIKKLQENKKMITANVGKCKQTIDHNR